MHEGFVSDAAQIAAESVKNYLKSIGDVVVAFSGGVDSLLLLYLAQQAGIRYVGVLIDSMLTPRAEVDFALKQAKKLHLGVDTIYVGLDLPKSVLENSPERCYFCKRYLFELVLEYANANKYANICDGSNYDDRSDYRPGMKALRELKVISPFDVLEIDKNTIRQMSRMFGIDNWNYPSKACLASRVPYGQALTASKLTKIETAEAKMEEFLNQNFCEDCAPVQFRVRAHDELARIELPRELLDWALKDDICTYICTIVREAGFQYVTLDLDGYRMGSMNEKLRKSNFRSVPNRNTVKEI